MNKVNKYSYASRIIARYLEKRYDAQLEEEVQRWLVADSNCNEKDIALQEFWGSLIIEPTKSVYSSLEKVKQKAGITGNKIKLGTHRKLLRIAAVLLPLFIAAGGVLLYLTSQQIQTITILAGNENIEEILPDGSHVWINTGSQITYLDKFKKDGRKVNLVGEAYFKVASEEDNDFRVETNYLSIKVTGTEFNVKAYPDEASTSVILVSGEVEVETPANEKFILEPDQQFLFDNETSEVTVNLVQSEIVSNWISGDLIFENETLSEIFQTLERSFHINFRINNSVIMSERLSVKFVNNENIEEILEILSLLTNGFDYSVNNTTVIIE